jgi:hypothetical protein
VYRDDRPGSEISKQRRNPRGSGLGDAEPEALVVHRATERGDEASEKALQGDGKSAGQAEGTQT